MKDYELMHLKTLRAALQLEIKGMKRSKGRSALSIAHTLLGTTGTKAQLLAKLDAKIKEEETKRKVGNGEANDSDDH